MTFFGIRRTAEAMIIAIIAQNCAAALCRIAAVANGGGGGGDGGGGGGCTVADPHLWTIG
jgi:hypothetical protein